MTNNGEKRRFPLNDVNSAIYPNVHRFLSSHDPRVRPQAEIDVFRFSNNKEPELERNVSNLEHRKLETKDTDISELFIIEAIDPSVVEYFLEKYVGADRRSFLRMLDDFCNDNPSFNAGDVQNHFPPRQSVVGRRRHLCMSCINIREFDRHFRLDWPTFDQAIQYEKLSGKSNSIYGIFVPTQRREYRSGPTTFPPGVLTRNQFAAWFDCAGDRHWRTGVVLVDRIVTMRIDSAWLKPPSYKIIARNDDDSLAEPDIRSYRSALSFYMENNTKLRSVRLPSRFFVLQDMFRIIASEWIVTNTYFLRDLNSIGWTLSNSQGKSDNGLVDDIDDNLDSLFLLQRRLTRYPYYLQNVLQTCRSFGPPGWRAALSTQQSDLMMEDEVSTELISDFEEILSLVSQNATRVEQSIQNVVALSSLLHSKLGIQETARTVTQNKLLTILSFVAVFFLPISSASAIFSMQGDWAPGEAKFGLFWAIVIPLSTLLLGFLILFRYWDLVTASIHDKAKLVLRDSHPTGPRQLAV